ncbi:MAG: hypothetical protein RJA07_1032 [Bacteroidota bacterium]|jgi:hypothetical protein
MNKLILLFISTFFTLTVFGQGNSIEQKKHEFKNEKMKCLYETFNGRINGNYTSYYHNGQKKAEGTFQNNYRIGKWIVWDSIGRIQMQREYENAFMFKKIIFATPTNKVITLPNTPRYTLHCNNEGYIDYYYVKEKMIEWQKRVWRFLPLENNEILFEHNLLFQILQTDTLTVYSDDEFTTELKPTIIDTVHNKIIGYKIKEDFFFDNERLLDEARIIGICPVVVNKQSNDTLICIGFTFRKSEKI